MKTRREHKLCENKDSHQAYVVIDGKREYLGRYGTVEAEIAYHQLVASFLIDRHKNMNPSSLRALSTAYLAEYRKRISPSQFRIESYAVERLGEFVDLDTSATDFGPRQFTRFREHLATKRNKKGQILKSSVVNKYLAAVRRMFRWGVTMEYIQADQLVALQAVTGVRDLAPKVTGVSSAQIEAVRPHVSDVIWSMVLLQLSTGARPGEVQALRRRDIDTSTTPWTATLSEHKMAYRGQSRTLFFGPRAQEILQPYMTRQPDEFLFSPVDEIRRKAESMTGEPVKPSKTHRLYARPFSRTAYSCAIRRACDAAGVERWHPHQLRHEAANQIQAVRGPDAVRAVLGHESLNTTQIYLDRDTKLARNVALEIG